MGNETASSTFDSSLPRGAGGGLSIARVAFLLASIAWVDTLEQINLTCIEPRTK
jgi:hypothetical protein